METKETKRIPLVKQSTTYKIIIPAAVERQIRFLCERVWDTEWSGVLFYTPSGDFSDGSLEIHCVDIFPMDIGNATYTEFNMSPDVISYMAQKPELLDCKMGLIHSHNNMSTFFSGTDTATLAEEGNERNHFVSLIVNNAGKYTAAITRKIKYHCVRDLSYEGFNGPVSIEGKEELEGEEIEYFYLDVIIEREENDAFREIADRLADIKKSKATTAKTAATNYPYYNGYGFSNPANKPVSAPTNTYKNPTLFDDDDYWTNPKVNPLATQIANAKSASKEKKSSIKDIPAVTEGDIFDKEDIEKVVNQLITGSVTVTKLDAQSKEKLINVMENRFDSRFGANDPSLTLFEYWATDFVEFLLWYSGGDKGVDFDECLAAEELATKTIAELSKLRSNKYIEKYVEIFEKYADKF